MWLERDREKEKAKVESVASKKKKTKEVSFIPQIINNFSYWLIIMYFKLLMIGHKINNNN